MLRTSRLAALAPFRRRPPAAGTAGSTFHSTQRTREDARFQKRQQRKKEADYCLILITKVQGDTDLLLIDF